MSDVDRLLSEFIAEDRAGGEADPRSYLDRLRGRDRLELEALIVGYLERAPRQRFDAERFAGSRAEAVVRSLEASLLGASGEWPSLLPRLRNRAELRRRDVVKRMAQALDVSSHEEKVSRYYHEMEQGRLPAAGVSNRVLDALGAILGVSADALRRAGETIGRPPAGAEPGAVFARTAKAQSAEGRAAGDGVTRPGEDPGQWDEIDELFLGG